MPKMKTKRAAAKRFRVTGSGKFKFQKAGRRHLLSSKSRSRKRQLRETGHIDPKDEVHLKRMLPYYQS
jgi:large subunit ribosomal protein L35